MISTLFHAVKQLVYLYTTNSRFATQLKDVLTFIVFFPCEILDLDSHNPLNTI